MAGDVWLDHRQAINCRGEKFDRAWTGTEHMAFGPVNYSQDNARVLATPDDVAEAVFERALQSGIDEERAKQHGIDKTRAAHGAPCVTCGEPSDRVIAGKTYCGTHGEPLPIPEVVLKRMVASGTALTRDEEAIKRARAESGRAILMEQLDADYEPERAARGRLLRQYGALRDDVFKGNVRVSARWPGQTEIRPVALDELRCRYPTDPHETTVELPSLPLPMTLVFNEADILSLRGRRACQTPISPGPKPLGKGQAERIAKEFVRSRNGQKTTQDDLWSELKKHGHCPA